MAAAATLRLPVLLGAQDRGFFQAVAEKLYQIPPEANRTHTDVPDQDDTFACIDSLRTNSRQSRSNSKSSSDGPTDGCTGVRRRSGINLGVLPHEQVLLQNQSWETMGLPESPPKVKTHAPPIKRFANSAIILDWDDTIFPTTWVREDVGLKSTTPVAEQIAQNPQLGMAGPCILRLVNRYVQEARQFLDDAVSHATVFIVTLAKRGWIETAIENIVPELGRHITQHNINIIYAQDFIKEVAGKDIDMSNLRFDSCETACEFWTKVKEKAILNQLIHLGNQNGVAWDVVVSIGDSDFERTGTIAASSQYADITNEASSSGSPHIVLTKTMKFLSDPTIEELTAQLSLMKMWLPFIMSKEGDMDFEFEDTEDDQKLMELNKTITGEHINLSWVKLANISE